MPGVRPLSDKSRGKLRAEPILSKRNGRVSLPAFGTEALASSRSPSRSASSESASSSSSSSQTSSRSNSESLGDSESEDDAVTSLHLNSLLEAAKAAMKAKSPVDQPEDVFGRDEILFSEATNSKPLKELPLPKLDPGPSLPAPYFKLAKGRKNTHKLVNDPENSILNKAASSRAIARSLPPPPELSKATGLPFTRSEKQKLKERTAGADWFDLPTPAPEDLPRLAREVEAMRLKNALDPKRFYRKEDTRSGPLPKHFAIGHIISESGPFGGKNRDDLPRAARKRTVVDELVADDEARRYAKKKFMDLQAVRGQRGRGTFRRKFASRDRKF